MVNDDKKTKKSVLIVFGTLFALFIVAALALFISGKGGAADISRLLEKSGAKEVSFFMENDHGTYNLVELSIPADAGGENQDSQNAGGEKQDTSAAGGEKQSDGKFPVVLMAHGFAGTLHSGGASELGARLADKGVLVARIDFDPYVTPDKGAERTHEYPLSQMEDDAVKLIGIIISEYGGDPDNISLYGRSYGGRLVMRMANESSGGYDYKKLALVAPAGDAVAFERYLGGKEKYDQMKKQALAAVENEAGGKTKTENYPEKLGVHITPQWFEDVESYDPTEYGWKFGNKSVLLFYNTLDHVVYPDTSIRCAGAYQNHEIIEVTTEDGHGYEMGYKKSELKDEIMDKLVDFLAG